jgi:hypothetical protein
MEILLLLGDDAAGASAGFVVGGIAGLWTIFWIIVTVLGIFWLWTLVAVAISDMSLSDKLRWFAVVFCLYFLGAVIYVVVANSNRTRPISNM